MTRTKKKTNEYLEEYSIEGLRTLCIAYREIPQAEYNEWNAIYERAANNINNRTAELDAAAELIEKDLKLLGATAIEDKLQDEVPDTIHTLMDAGIKVWVLTGDRIDTAINIGNSCKLLNEDMEMLICQTRDRESTKQFFQDALKPIPTEKRQSFGIKRLGKKAQLDKNNIPDIDPLALVIDGEALNFAFERDVELEFLELATLCKAVICCRVTPLQKALVVRLVKDHVLGSVTLAIGDGANDVNMIQAAHVGVGISGMEGLQAARAADFAIAQFRFLRKLLLVHGGWAYSRLSKLILYSFYKNITMYLIQLWFAIDNGFSGQTLFESWTQSAYNVAFAVFQPVAIGVFDAFVSARMLDRYPQMYKLGQRAEFYNNRVFAAWIANSFMHSLIIYYMMRTIYGDATMLSDGRIASNWLLGQMVYTTDLLTISWKAALIADTWVKFTWMAIFGSIGIWFVLFPVYCYIAPMLGLSEELSGLVAPMFGNAAFWFGVLLVPVTAMIRDFTWKYIKRTYLPQPYHIVQEIQRYNIPDYRPRQEWFKKVVFKVRQIQRLKRSKGFAFSQSDGQADLIRQYDTTKAKPKG